MKKTTFVLITVLILILSVSPVLAKSPNTIIKGQVTEVNDAGKFTILTATNESILITAPSGFDMAALQVGSEVIIKGALQDDGSLIADWVKVTGKPATVGAATPEAEDEDTELETNGLQNNPYCSGEKETAHPMAVFLAEKYSVSTEWVMGYFCSGVGMGSIFLALKTSEIQGISADDVLAQYATGQGWGAIWQELKLIGSQKDLKRRLAGLKKVALKNN